MLSDRPPPYIWPDHGANLMPQESRLSSLTVKLNHRQVGGALKQMNPTSRFQPEYLDELAPALGVGVGLALRRVEV